MSESTLSTVDVKGIAYGLEAHDWGFRVVKPKTGEVYDIVSCDDPVESNRFGWSCTCPDHAVRHAGVPSNGCKHFQAIQSAGLIDPPVNPPVPPPTPSAPSFALKSPEVNGCLAFGPDVNPVQAITERYRPRKIADIQGQGFVRLEIESFLESPYSCAFLFVGPTGIGKTTAALALAAELGAGEFSGLSEIKSGMQDAEAVETALNNLRFTPMFSQTGWKVVIVDEADYMSQKASNLWLSALEDLPAKSVVIFTTNRPEKFPDRFIDRCNRIDFESRAAVLSQDADTLIRTIWAQEGAPGEPPTIADLGRIVDDNGALSFRRVVQAVGQQIRRRIAESKAAAPVVAVEPTPVVAEPIAVAVPTPVVEPIAEPIREIPTTPEDFRELAYQLEAARDRATFQAEYDALHAEYRRSFETALDMEDDAERARIEATYPVDADRLVDLSTSVLIVAESAEPLWTNVMTTVLSPEVSEGFSDGFYNADCEPCDITSRRDRIMVYLNSYATGQELWQALATTIGDAPTDPTSSPDDSPERPAGDPGSILDVTTPNGFLGSLPPVSGASVDHRQPRESHMKRKAIERLPYGSSEQNQAADGFWDRYMAWMDRNDSIEGYRRFSATQYFRKVTLTDVWYMANQRWLYRRDLAEDVARESAQPKLSAYRIRWRRTPRARRVVEWIGFGESLEGFRKEAETDIHQDNPQAVILSCEPTDDPRNA